MYILKIEANPLGGRPPMQTWSRPVLPEGYAWCPDAFYDVFYSTTPAGFVNITVEGDTVVGMTVNTDAYNAYVAANPPAAPAEAAIQPHQLWWGMIDPELSAWFARIPDTDGEQEQALPVLWNWSWRSFWAALTNQTLIKETSDAARL